MVRRLVPIWEAFSLVQWRQIRPVASSFPLLHALKCSVRALRFFWTDEPAPLTRRRIWGQDGGRWVCESILEDAHDRTVRSVAWAPGDDKLATASFDGTCVIWSCREGDYEQIATLQGHENEVKSVAWDASGNLLATCSRDKSVWVWENVDGEDDYECVAVLHGHSQDVKMVGFHPSKEVLVSASYDDTVRTWEADEDDWAPGQILDSHASTGLVVLFFASMLMFSQHACENICVFCVCLRPRRLCDAYRAKQRPDACVHAVWTFSLDSSGQNMATASDDTTIRFWRDANGPGSTTCKFEEAAVLRGFHTRAIMSIDWRYGLDVLASGGADDTVCIFAKGESPDTASSMIPEHASASAPPAASAVPPAGGVKQPLEGKAGGWVLAAQQLAAHDGDVNCVRWCPVPHTSSSALASSHTLATAGDDGLVKIWRFAPDA